MKQLNLPDIDFHDLRHTFTTLIVKSNFNAKAISQLLGHVSEIITIDVYTDNRQITIDCLDILEPFIENLIPEDEEKGLVYDYSDEKNIIHDYYNEIMAK